MTTGLVLFTLTDSKVQPNFNIYGVFLVSLSLVTDSLVGNLQERAMKQSESTNKDMIFFTYSFGFLYLLLWHLLVEKNLEEAFFLSYEVYHI